VRAVLLVAAVYAAAGLVFGALAGDADSQRARIAWRWAAWAVSAAAFGAQIVYEQLRLRRSPTSTARDVAAAVALGAFALAVAANVHRLMTPTSDARAHATALGLSLALWPLITAIPAFVVALAAAALVARAARGPRDG
jgi:disulfide bond formation protein DsbB